VPACGRQVVTNKPKSGDLRGADGKYSSFLRDTI
jgi:hypothetical protein